MSTSFSDSHDLESPGKKIVKQVKTVEESDFMSMWIDFELIQLTPQVMSHLPLFCDDFLW